MTTTSPQQCKALYQEALDFQRSEDVVKYGKILLTKTKDLSVHEIKAHVLFHAAVLGDQAYAKKLYLELDAEFPSSSLVSRLASTCLQLGETKDIKSSVVLARSLLDKDETDMAKRKALLALMRADPKATNYVETLQKHLSDITTDVGAWKELADASLRTGKLAEARLCCEEIALLLDPENLAMLVLLADICFELDQLVAASKYFSLAIVYHPTNYRALWGLVTTYTAMCQSKDKDDYAEIEKIKFLAIKAADTIIDLYQMTLQRQQSCQHVEETTSNKVTDQADDRKSDHNPSMFLQAQLEFIKEIRQDINDR